MASLKDLRVRIASVTSTRKITSAMKMVAASKLRRAQSAAEQARPYATAMERMLGALAAGASAANGAPGMLAGTGRDSVHLVVVVTSDRGLCGGFNSSVVRAAKLLIEGLSSAGKTVKIMTIGRKGRDQLKREYGDRIVEKYENIGRKGVVFGEAEIVAAQIAAMFDDGQFDVCTVIYNHFKSAISQVVTVKQLVPFPVVEETAPDAGQGPKAVYEFEPSDEEVLALLLPRNLAVQVFGALLESTASEHGARMSAMDSATRNAGEMIDHLTLRYNRTRQAKITNELIEIISGAEAL